MPKIVRNIASEAAAISLAHDIYIERFRIRGVAIDPARYNTDRSCLVAPDDQNPGKFAMFDPIDYDIPMIEEVAAHRGTDPAIKAAIASRQDYDEAQADILEPRSVGKSTGPGQEDIQIITYTRSEDREVQRRRQMAANRGRSRLDVVEEVIAERP